MLFLLALVVVVAGLVGTRALVVEDRGGLGAFGGAVWGPWVGCSVMTSESGACEATTILRLFVGGGKWGGGVGETDVRVDLLQGRAAGVILRCTMGSLGLSVYVYGRGA